MRYEITTIQVRILVFQVVWDRYWRHSHFQTLALAWTEGPKGNRRTFVGEAHEESIRLALPFSTHLLRQATSWESKKITLGQNICFSRNSGWYTFRSMSFFCHLCKRWYRIPEDPLVAYWYPLHWGRNGLPSARYQRVHRYPNNIPYQFSIDESKQYNQY